MKKYFNCFFICLDNDIPVGYVRVIDNDISVAVIPNKQGKGIGLFLINNIKKRFKKAEAKIKIDNKASIKLFEKAGFKLRYYLYG